MRPTRRLPAPVDLVSALVMGSIWLGASCGGGARSGDSLPDSTVVDVLADLHIAQARAELYGQPAWSWRDSVLAANDVDSLRLARALNRYARDPEETVALYTRVLDRINERWRPPGGPPR